ncbi:MHC class II transactivator isoform X1 [Oreochromis aureus]|uniref:NACHT domain-containing protein n=2 Tax=Oreochromis aureus TaxID=47969 RepID=A0AAZ1X496_OREAU|nr:MHC class II transactivator isoform X1 [Oreochromis aureus]
MAHFEEVLDEVRSALTWASPAEIRALLEGLVEEQIISEAYSKSLGLHRFTDGLTPELLCGESGWILGSDEPDGVFASRASSTHQHLSHGPLIKVRKGGSQSPSVDYHLTGSEFVPSVDDHYSTRLEPETCSLYEDQVISRDKLIQELREGTAMDEHYPTQSLYSVPTVFDGRLALNDDITELLTSAPSMQKPVSDSERVNQGNLEIEREWLEQIEEAARRIAVPLWQHWDKGRRMLQPLVYYNTTGCSTSDNTVTYSEAQCAILDLEEEMELAAACRTLDACTGNFNTSFTLDDEEAADTPEEFYYPLYDEVPTPGICMDPFKTFGLEGNASPVEACEATDSNNNVTDNMGGLLDAWWPGETTDDLCCLTEDTQCGAGSALAQFTFQHLSPSFAPQDASVTAEDDMMAGVTENVYGTETWDIDGVTGMKDTMESHCNVKMLEVDPNPITVALDLDLLLDDLADEINEKLLDVDSLFEYLELNDSLPHPSWPFDDLPTAAEVPITNSIEQIQKPKAKGQSRRRKRPRDSQPQLCSDESPKAKSPKPSGQPKTKESPAKPAVESGSDPASGPSPAETLPIPVTTTPPRFFRVYPSQTGSAIPIQIITISDSAGNPVQLSPPPPLIRFPIPGSATTPTYILVPTVSPPSKCQLPPLSPVDGTVAPVHMSSSPLGSLSETASKAMSPPCTSPVSPGNEMSPCKESPLPQSPKVLDIPQTVKDYIQEAKAHMSQTYQDMETGLSLSSHYVDVQVSQREVIRSGKNTNKCLDKELVIKGDTDRQKTMLALNQIFDGSNGEKPRRYILLLGNAGMGKTTLIKKLCIDWSRDCIPQFDFVFLLDGKKLSVTEPVYSLQTLLLNLSSSAPSCVDPEAVYAQVLAAPKRVLIIFDGFDELRNYETLLQAQEKDLTASLQKDSKAKTFTVRQLYSAILQRVLLPGCTLLLSTRPRGTASQLLRRTDSLLEMCGFTPANVETYLSQYFSDPSVRESALESLKSMSYLNLLCWNPGLCRLVCLILEQSQSVDVLPRTLTGLCHQVLCLKMVKDGRSTPTHTEAQAQSVEDTETQTSNTSQVKKCSKNNQAKSRTQTRTSSRPQRAKKAHEQEAQVDKVDQDLKSSGGEAVTEDRELLSQLSTLAWEGVKANSSILPTGRDISAKVKAFGLRTGLFLSHHLRASPCLSSGAKEEGENETEAGETEQKTEHSERTANDITDHQNDQILLWANPFLQSYIAAVHLVLSRTVTDRSFLQTLPFQSGGKGRRRPQREELELTQRFAVGLLFHNRTELQRFHTHTETAFRDMVANKQGLVTKHLEGLSYADLSPSQILEACHYVYEASFTYNDGGRDAGRTRLVTHLAANLPEFLTFHGVQLSPPDVFTVQKALEQGGTEGRRFCLDLEDSGIQICGLRALVGLNNINTYRSCIADTITLWQLLEQSDEESLLQRAVSKFTIHPLKAKQVCHIEHLEKLVNIHIHKRLSDSSSESHSILSEGVPAVKELHKLEFELGPDNGPLVLPKLWDLLPGLHNLQHLDLENSKIGDKGAEKLASALVSLPSLEILNLSQNCIGDEGVKKLADTLKDLPNLHCLSLYSNMISDEGAESLAAVLPHMASLTDLDVKFNKLTDVGAQSLGASLRNCTKIKTLRMWNQCIPFGVLERLIQQDSRILLH